MSSLIRKLLFSVTITLFCSILAYSQESQKHLVNINKDPIEILVTLPGIGYGLAKRIIDYREVQKFKNIEDVINVDGIGTGNFEKFKDMITVDD